MSIQLNLKAYAQMKRNNEIKIHVLECVSVKFEYPQGPIIRHHQKYV